MTRSPIRKVLSVLHSFRVRHLLMGGQACVFYGAAEFSRDTDIVLLADGPNFSRLQDALEELQAECIAVPPLSLEYLHRGHAVHVRSFHPEAERIRIDIMSVLRNVAPFATLWARRTSVELPNGDSIELMALPDLVQAKKTQRDKDWPMVRRLVEAHYEQNRDRTDPEPFLFWLTESRTPGMLIELAGRVPDLAQNRVDVRPLLRLAMEGDEAGLQKALQREEEEIREQDRAYWAPLRAELEELRRRRSRD